MRQLRRAPGTALPRLPRWRSVSAPRRLFSRSSPRSCPRRRPRPTWIGWSPSGRTIAAKPKPRGWFRPPIFSTGRRAPRPSMPVGRVARDAVQRQRHGDCCPRGRHAGDARPTCRSVRLAPVLGRGRSRIRMRVRGAPRAVVASLSVLAEHARRPARRGRPDDAARWRAGDDRRRAAAAAGGDWLLVPLSLDAQQRRAQRAHAVRRCAPAPGVSIEAARAEMEGIGQALEREFPDTNRGWTVNTRPAAGRVRRAAGAPRCLPCSAASSSPCC